MLLNWGNYVRFRTVGNGSRPYPPRVDACAARAVIPVRGKYGHGRYLPKAFKLHQLH
jgi:hypothetical protein